MRREEADGTVVPLQYGFARAHVLGNLLQEPLGAMAARWKRDGYPAFSALCRRTFDRLGEAALPIANWYRLVAQVAESGHGAEAVAAA